MLRHTTFRQLTAIEAIARNGSVSRAAAELHLTQPAVSLQVRQLEEVVGAPLLRRQGRGIELTDAGATLARYARRILELWNEAGDAMAQERGIFSGTLRVGAEAKLVNGQWTVTKAIMSRSARTLMSGWVHVPADCC